MDGVWHLAIPSEVRQSRKALSLTSQGTHKDERRDAVNFKQ